MPICVAKTPKHASTLNPMWRFPGISISCVDAAGWQDSSSYTCLDYRTNSWCAGGAVTNSNYAGYDAEENCCACGAVRAKPCKS